MRWRSRLILVATLVSDRPRISAIAGRRSGDDAVVVLQQPGERRGGGFEGHRGVHALPVVGCHEVVRTRAADITDACRSFADAGTERSRAPNTNGLDAASVTHPAPILARFLSPEQAPA